MLTCRTLTFNVEPSDTVASIKALISDKEGIDPAQQKLIFAKKQLEGGKTVAECDITEGSTIYLGLIVKEDISIFIKAPTGWTTSLNVELSDSVENLKAKVSEKTQLPVSHFKLTLPGVELEDKKILSDYNLTKKSTLGLFYIKFSSSV